MIAEGGEIRNGTELLVGEEVRRIQEEAINISISLHDPDSKHCGLMQKIENPMILEECLQGLEFLKLGVEKFGFVEELSKLRDLLYGNVPMRAGMSLRDMYNFYLYLTGTKLSETITEEEVAEYKRQFLSCLDGEVARLKRLKRLYAKVEDERLQIESLRKSVPDGPHLDRLLRYETTLERSFDRTLSQLEHVQRIRLGQPVPPRLEIDMKVDRSNG
jgi:hypothetical protein